MRQQFFAIAVVLWSGASCSKPPENISDVRSLYDSLPVFELSMRFAHPELYRGRDDFARMNALQEILDRGVVARGMSKDHVRRILGTPDDAEGCSGKPARWSYGALGPSGLSIDYDDRDTVVRILWHFDQSPGTPCMDKEY